MWYTGERSKVNSRKRGDRLLHSLPSRADGGPNRSQHPPLHQSNRPGPPPPRGRAQGRTFLIDFVQRKAFGGRRIHGGEDRVSGGQARPQTHLRRSRDDPRNAASMLQGPMSAERLRTRKRRGTRCTLGTSVIQGFSWTGGDLGLFPVVARAHGGVGAMGPPCRPTAGGCRSAAPKAKTAVRKPLSIRKLRFVAVEN